ncbi:MAG: immunoglobulin domain-containing protein, partial [Oscillospiraceae bacterium]|nr:immunoglobulin domain-containing protein [Oscillospiraceae bacterium]
MKQWMKQSLALLLCLCMLCAALPAAEVSAEEIDVIPVPEEEAGDEIVILDEDDLAPTAPNGETPSITTQPSSKKTCVGYGVSFTVKAENATKYQWYYRASSSADWVKVPEDTATKSTLTYSAVGLGLNGFQYRCKVSNSYGSLYSNTVKLTVTIEPAITTQPKSKTVDPGETAKFTVKATGALSYQWYWRTSKSAAWQVSTLTGNKTATLSVVGKASRSGYQYRCLVANGQAYTYTNTVTLTVTDSGKPSITTQPESITASVGATAKFTVKASGATKYQWYYRTSSTGSWHAASLTGNKTASLSVPATSARSGYQYRCKVSNANGYVYSKAVTLTVKSTGTKPTITTQPESITAYVGATAKFTVKASNATKYQWYYRTSSSGSWHAASLTGNKTASLSVPATSARSGYQYRCKVSNASGYVYTRAVTLTVKSGAKPSITSQPSSITKAQDYTAKFTVKASNATKYQWYYRTRASGSWSKTTLTGATTATL